jgi:hypothetical protein
MATIVAGLLIPHAPLITAKPVIGEPEKRERFVAALAEMRRRLEAARPDVLVAFVNDHVQNFFYDNLPAFCVGVADAYWAPSEGGSRFLKIPARRVAGAGAWSRALLEAGLEGGFDFAYSHELEFWDDLSVPLSFLAPDDGAPVVPVLTNCVAPPLPAPRRSWQLGGFVREFVGRRPAGERVALLGTGGLSHWIGVPGHGQVNPEFDRKVLAWIAEGRGDAVGALTTEEIERDGGNGGQEIRNWIAVLGALPGVKGELLVYDPVPDWLIGSGVVWLEP